MSTVSIDLSIYQPIVDQIVSTVHPLKIVVFGSVARGESTPQSDLDLLIIVPNGMHRRRSAQAIYRSLIGIDLPVDVVVVTEEDIEVFSDQCGLIIRPALDEGQILYAA